VRYWVRAQIRPIPTAVVVLLVATGSILATVRIELPFSNSFEVAAPVLLSIVPALLLLRSLRPEQGSSTSVSPRPIGLIHTIAWLGFGTLTLGVAGVIGAMVGEPIVTAAFIRNITLLTAGGGVTASILGFEWAWVTPVLYFLACCLLGLENGQVTRPWALLLHDGTSVGGLLTTAIAVTFAIVLTIVRYRPVAADEASRD